MTSLSSDAIGDLRAHYTATRWRLWHPPLKTSQPIQSRPVLASHIEDLAPTHCAINQHAAHVYAFRIFNVAEHWRRHDAAYFSHLSINTILHVTAAYYHVTVEAVVGPSRIHGAVMRARMTAMYLANLLCKKSLPEIGRRFNRDHTTVLHAKKKMEKLIATDVAFAADIGALCGILQREPTT